ncbi:MAG: pyruvate formate lyase family protein, partial [Acutalibacteraceae bacterium]|nr:pyruvate formate lyase family protein [Acutalibacteraceae bacterium]
MWNDFEKSKNFIKEYYRKKSPNCTLCERVFETEEEYSKTSTSRAKAESIIYILENAAVSIAPDDIFALKINHGEIMRRFMENKLSQKPLISIRKGVEAFEYSNTFKANMDFGHVAPDWQNVLKKGISGIISELEIYRQKHDESASYYEERIMVYTAIKKCFMRFAELAESRQGEKSKFIAQNLRHLAEN